MPTKAAVQKRKDRQVERLDAFFRDGDYKEEQVAKIKRLVKDGLDDAEWSKLKLRHKLPDMARDGVHRTVWAYWDFQVSESISGGLRSKINDLSSRLKDAHKRLADLASHPDFFKGAWAFYDKSPLKQKEIIDLALTSLHEVDVLMESAKHRITRPNFKRLPYYHATFMGIMTLETMMLQWGWQLKRTHARFATDIFCDADPHLKRESFGPVFKDYLSVRPEWDTTSFWTEPKYR
jgi:hypothetical protein